jgi:predicted ATP-binding protein involved in virulence
MIIDKLQEYPSYIKNIEIIGIFNRFDIILEDLQPGINILHGDNGSGKTTVLHIIANALNDDYERFIDINFHQIEITFNDSSFIRIIKLEHKDTTLNEDYKESEEDDKSKKNQSEELVLVERSDLRRQVMIRRKPSEEDERVTQKNEDIRRLRFSQSNSFPQAAYFPAFRNIMEAWNLLGKTDEQNVLARQLFGEFVPSLNYLSPPQIEEQLLKEFRKAKKAVIDHNQEVLSKSFGDILLSFSSLEKDGIESEVKEIFQQIKHLSKIISNHPLQTDINFVAGLEEKIDKAFILTQGNPNLSVNFPLKVLNTYRDALQEIVNFQDEVFNPISSFIELFNASLHNKKIEINRGVSVTEKRFLKIAYSDGISFGGIQYLSSGERQIFTLMYAVTHISERNIVLIDEPEISIHIDAQSLLLDSLSNQTTEKQIIACTHSQRIAGKQRERLKKVQLLGTDGRKWLDTLQTEKSNSGEGYKLSDDIESSDEE